MSEENFRISPSGTATILWDWGKLVSDQVHGMVFHDQPCRIPPSPDAAGVIVKLISLPRGNRGI